MTVSKLFQYSLPALVAGAVGGYFVGSVLAQGSSSKASRGKSSLRSDFLSTSDDELDYDKLARVCLTAAERGPARASSEESSSGATVHQAAPRGDASADPTSPKVTKFKENLDHVVSVSLEKRMWTHSSGTAARMLLRRLPPSDVADFERLLGTMLEQGDLDIQPGAWIPESLK